MSDNTTTDQNQTANAGVPAKDADRPTAETVPANNASRTNDDQPTGSGTSQEQSQDQQTDSAPKPKPLLSHYRGMPNQWEKNRNLKKDDE